MRFFRIVILAFLFVLLTLLTQVGGLVILLSYWISPLIADNIKTKGLRYLSQMGVFLLLYGIFTAVIVPILAPLGGRVPLPIRTTQHVRPLRYYTFLLNRHYVKPMLREAVYAAANQMNMRFPECEIQYLDAGFPFIEGFPLIPHLSHNDGKKLDIAFVYQETATGKPTHLAPSWLGYGIFEAPRKGEVNTAQACEEKGFWQYGMLKYAVLGASSSKYQAAEERCRYLVESFVSQDCIGKVFLEPHLTTRWKLSSEKIRFHGCRAVRHDDHLHVQLK